MARISKHHKRFHYPPLFKHMKRGGPAIILPKDAGAIISYTGIGKNSTVVELGSGAGCMTIFFANIVKEVISFEKRNDFLKLARENVKNAGLKNVKFVNKDVYEGFGEELKDVDLVFADLPEPENVIENAYKILKKDGFFVSYCPNIEQVKRAVLKGKEFFSDIFTIEVLVREYEVREYGTRPKHLGLLHSAYLSFFRK